MRARGTVVRISPYVARTERKSPARTAVPDCPCKISIDCLSKRKSVGKALLVRRCVFALTSNGTPLSYISSLLLSVRTMLAKIPSSPAPFSFQRSVIVSSSSSTVGATSSQCEFCGGADGPCFREINPHVWTYVKHHRINTAITYIVIFLEILKHNSF